MNKMRWRLFFLPALLSVVLAGCLQPAGTIETPPEEQDLVEPFTNEITGYYSNLALEMEGVFTGIIEMDLSNLPEGERDSFVSGLRSDRWTVLRHAGDHMKYAKKQLNTEKLHMNLSTNSIEFYEVGREGERAKITYSLSNETLIMNSDLEAAGIDPDNFTSKQYTVRLPADPRNIFDRVGDACAEGMDEPEDLRNDNYFYYFAPDKPGCELSMVNATFTLNSLLPRKITYPEYDKLTADRKVTVAVFFGAAKHEDPPPSNDWGVWEHRDFVRDLGYRGFSRVGNLDPKGVRYKRTRSGIEEIVDVVSPNDLSALNHDTNGLFKQALQTHEIVAYLGHSFYGSLSALKDRSAYPADTYQIIYMNSCWSYEYYTKQVFENKTTERDPRGWELADVVNNTEVGWFSHNAEEARILLTNLFAGCESGGATSNRRYDWEGIIKAMNRFALDNIPSGKDEHEIYGVSGVTNNCYDPRDPERCSCTDECHQAGYKECINNGVRSCTNHDDDPCLEWTEVVPCKPDEECINGECIRNCADDGFEDNDQPEGAKDISAGDLGSLRICTGDDDWYKIRLEADDILEVEILFGDEVGDLDMQLYAEGDYQSSVSGSTSSTDNERISHQVEVAGSYYIKVFGYSSAENSYQMTVSVTAGSGECRDECTEEGQRECIGDGYRVCGAGHDSDECLEWGEVTSCNGQACQDGQCVEENNDCSDDAYENNDDLSSASSLSAGSYDLRVCGGDDDWYRVQLESGDELQVSISFNNADGDLELQLTDQAGAELQSSTTTNDTESVTLEAEAAGSYFVRVYGYNGAQNTYTLSLSLSSDNTGCQDDQLEPNDDFAHAHQLQTTVGPSTFSGLKLCAGDQDWFGVQLYAGETLKVDLSFTHASGDLDVALHDQSQGLLVEGTSNNDNETLQYQATSDGLRYIQIYGHGSAENSYDMVVTVQR